MRIRYWVVLAACLFVADSACAANSWKNNVSITGLYNTAAGGFLLFLAPGSDPVCGPSGNLFYVQPGENGVNSEGAKAALAIALTAFTLGKTINLYYDDALSDCAVQIVWINP